MSVMRNAAEGSKRFDEVMNGQRTLIRAGWLLLRIGLAAVFLWAGAMKARGPQRFALDIESYRLVPGGLARMAAYYLPWLEIVCGLGMLTRRAAPGATLLAGALMAVFTAALLSAWARGLEIRCGCFGADDVLGADYMRWLLRDAALLAGCAALWGRLARVARRRENRIL